MRKGGGLSPATQLHRSHIFHVCEPWVHRTESGVPTPLSSLCVHYEVMFRFLPRVSVLPNIGGGSLAGPPKSAVRDEDLTLCAWTSLWPNLVLPSLANF